MKRRWTRSLFTAALAMFTCLVTAAAAYAVDEFPLPAGSNPTGIIAGPDGALWFTEEGGNKIGRMTTGGVLTTEIPIPTAGSLPSEIAVGPDGKLWFTEFTGNKIGRVDANGICEFNVPDSGSQPDGITAGPDGALWFTQFGGNEIGRIPIDAACGSSAQEFGPTGSGPGDITLGPDGGLWFTESVAGSIRRIDPTTKVLGAPVGVPNGGGVVSDPSGITSSGGALWFTQSGSSEIGRLTPGGTLTEFGPTAGDPSSIVTGADGALWFTESTGHSIGRITPSGSITNHFATPTGGSEPSGIAAGPDGALWFTEKLGNKIGRIATAPPFVPPPPPPPPPGVAPKAVKKCKVPKLRGLTVKKARQKLKKAGCKYKIRGKGRVRSTVPKAGRTTTKRVTVKCKRKAARRR